MSQGIIPLISGSTVGAHFKNRSGLGLSRGGNPNCSRCSTHLNGTFLISLAKLRSRGWRPSSMFQQCPARGTPEKRRDGDAKKAHARDFGILGEKQVTSLRFISPFLASMRVMIP